ncbi:ThiF family adenylyltransferase [Acrocarpospora sp. B8E8]|uniref:ThiF family adenylyltransferase n=1 Tax=Acrocarpospora sp. B8E8 TaxID=3153572 RepID=UPI00325E44C4
MGLRDAHPGWPARPRLKPILRMRARDSRTLQFGSHPARAVVLADVEPPVRRLIEALDGTRTLDQVIATSELDPGAVTETIKLLAVRGLLDDASVRPDATLTTAERERLRPDLATLSFSGMDGGIGALARRRDTQVRIYGAGRVGAQIAILLAAAGIGHLCVVDPGTARNDDVVPGGLGWAQVGSPREDGAVALARAQTPSVNAWPGRTASGLGDGAQGPDLVVLAPMEPLDPLLIRDLAERGLPHLLVTCQEGCGGVGPLVLPGETACLDCLDLTRGDRDPGWPALRIRPGGEAACDTVLSALVASLAAGHALAFLDGGKPAVSNGTVDILPDRRWRQRSWQPHPRCPCSRNPQAALTMVA